MDPPAPPGYDDELLLLSSALKQQTGRAKGQPNFRGDEDVMLASAYVVVTTNAAIGTDQNGAAFWEKIRVSFLQRGGNCDWTQRVFPSEPVLQGSSNGGEQVHRYVDECTL